MRSRFLNIKSLKKIKNNPFSTLKSCTIVTNCADFQLFYCSKEPMKVCVNKKNVRFRVSYSPSFSPDWLFPKTCFLGKKSL